MIIVRGFSRWTLMLGIATLAVLTLGCAEPLPEATVADSEIARAREVLLPFKQQLKQALMQGLEEGPEGAIPVCRMEAGKIASANSIDGIRMGRTSHKLRNPDNAPAAWIEPLLADYARNGDRSPHRAVQLADGRIGYVEPIYVAPMCLSCHGPAVSGPLADAIHELYPADQATGFKAEEFRGLFWVELPAGARS